MFWYDFVCVMSRDCGFIDGTRSYEGGKQVKVKGKGPYT